MQPRQEPTPKHQQQQYQRTAKMFHLKYRLPFALAIAALMVVTVTIWTPTTEDGKGKKEQAARWGTSTDLRRALTTSFFPPSWTGAADQWAGGATPSIDNMEEEGDEEGESKRALGGDDLVAPFLREDAAEGENEDDAAVGVVGVDESRELQSTCTGQCRGDYQCDPNQPCFKCMYYNRNLDGVCCEPDGGGCKRCGDFCNFDNECGLNGCIFCDGGVCTDRRRFGNPRYSGTCIDSSMCPLGCSCIARLCQ